MLHHDNPLLPRPVSKHSERGEGKLKAIVVTVVLALSVFVAFKVTPAFVADYQLKDKMQEIAKFAVVNRDGEDQVRDKVYRVVQDLDIPVKREQIKVTAAQRGVTISVSYTVPIDLKFYQTDLHFTTASENASIM